MKKKAPNCDKNINYQKAKNQGKEQDGIEQNGKDWKKKMLPGNQLAFFPPYTGHLLYQINEPFVFDSQIVSQKSFNFSSLDDQFLSGMQKSNQRNPKSKLLYQLDHGH